MDWPDASLLSDALRSRARNEDHPATAKAGASRPAQRIPLRTVDPSVEGIQAHRRGSLRLQRCTGGRRGGVAARCGSYERYGGTEGGDDSLHWYSPERLG